ncbi:cytochrome P450 [Streptomyces sp. NPDC047061]|uniref:cytochrome P450 n=1 Tax=Streptomyces sp. NPDC047061 TaxID=3154605 RepID=UPI0033E62D3E
MTQPLDTRDQTSAGFRPVPVAPGRLPVLGHAVPLFRRPLHFLRSLEQVGELVRVDIGALPMVVITDAGLTRQVLTDSRTFDKGGALFDKVRELTGDSLLTSRFETHRRQRRLMQPAFGRARVQAYAKVMNSMIDAVLGEWEEGSVIDVAAAAYDITSRTAARTMFAADVAGPAAARVVAALSVYLHGLFLRMMAPSGALGRLPTPGNLRYERAVRLLHSSVDEIIEAYRASGEDHGDLLSMLLAAGDDDDGERLSPQEIHDQVITLFLAGIETTAAALSWSLYLLGAHPEAAERLWTEVDSVLGGRSADWTDIGSLPETRRVITEALRMYPPGWIFTRVTTAEVALGPHLLPAGTGLAYSPYLLHHDPGVFADPDRFDPDRWLPERAASVSKGAFVPFGGGVHKCIGDTFGMTEATLALATIAARWTLAPEFRGPVEPAPRRATLSPARLPMRVAGRP